MCLCVVLALAGQVSLLMSAASTVCLCSVLKKYEPTQNISTPASNSVMLKLSYVCAAILWSCEFVFQLFSLPISLHHCMSFDKAVNEEEGEL